MLFIIFFVCILYYIIYFIHCFNMHVYNAHASCQCCNIEYMVLYTYTIYSYAADFRFFLLQYDPLVIELTRVNNATRGLMSAIYYFG